MQLRTFSRIDRLQPLVAGFLGTVCVGDPPLPGDSAVLVEVAPGMAVNALLDAALKATRCTPGLFVVERRFGVLQLHHRDQGLVEAAGDAILAAAGLSEEDRERPEVVTAERITGIDPHHAQIVNRMRHGDEIVDGQTLYVLETRPAGYALVAANEAEKAARVGILEIRAFGDFGRVYLGGGDAEVVLAAEAAIASLAAG